MKRSTYKRHGRTAEVRSDAVKLPRGNAISLNDGGEPALSKEVAASSTAIESAICEVVVWNAAQKPDS